MAAVVAWLAGPDSPADRWYAAHPKEPDRSSNAVLAQVLATGWPWLLALGLVLTVWIAARLFERRSATPRWSGLMAVCVLLGLGLYGTVGTITGLPFHRRLVDSLDAVPAGSRTRMSSDQLAAGRWLRIHARPDDVMAVNVPCLPVRPRPQNGLGTCDSRNFTMTAAAGLRSDVEGWAYTSRIVNEATTTAVPYPYLPFWDQARLEAEVGAFTHPTPAGLAALRERWHVRWLVADLRGGERPARALDRLAVRRLTSPGVIVWELPAAAGRDR